MLRNCVQIGFKVYFVDYSVKGVLNPEIVSPQMEKWQLVN